MTHPQSDASPPAPPACRAVHLDLKGLPPTPARLLSLLPLFVAAGYNAVLVEWEDSFPWTVDERFRSPEAYTADEVRALVHAAAEHGLELIPLVQCMGHMETALSPDDHAALREQPNRCDGLNPLAPGARELVASMVDDVLALMPGVKRFHLGGDEAWTFATHSDTAAYARQHGKAGLYLQHVQPLLEQLKTRGIRPLLWHDMMSDWPDDAVAELGRQCDLVVWGYGQPPEGAEHPHARDADRFANLGVTLWGAGAYKGCHDRNLDLPDADMRLSNGAAWLAGHRRLGFAGLIATAWSRFSTDRIQIQPIDAALDVMVRLGRLWTDGRDPGPEAALDLLRSTGDLDVFTACRDALKTYAGLRSAAWLSVQRNWENLALADLDPTRRGSGILHQVLDGQRDRLDQLETAGRQVAQAMKGLTADRWIHEYLAPRLAPLRDQLAQQQQALHHQQPASRS